MNNFKNFLERKDSNKIQQISSLSELILKQLETYYNNLFNIYFPLPKQIYDHEKFMDWRNHCRKYETQLPEYEGRKFSIQGNHTNLGGEYLDTRIYLYDNNFNTLHNELRNHHFSYEYNARTSSRPKDKRENPKIKKEAKAIHEKMMKVFESKKEVYLSTLFHEIVHLFDHQKLGSKFDTMSNNATNKLNKELKSNPENLHNIYNKIYMNSDIETNAWFLTNAKKSLKNKFTTFQDALSDFKTYFGKYWDLLSSDKQKKMINRLYQLYQQ